MSFVVLASITVPYSSHTCLMSNQTNVQFTANADACMSGNLEKYTEKETQINKSSCCIIDNGLIDIDVELVLSSLNSFIPYLPVQSFSFEALQLNTYTTKPAYVVASNSSYIPIRIMQQSFLC